MKAFECLIWKYKFYSLTTSALFNEKLCFPDILRTTNWYSLYFFKISVFYSQFFLEFSISSFNNGKYTLIKCCWIFLSETSINTHSSYCDKILRTWQFCLKRKYFSHEFHFSTFKTLSYVILSMKLQTQNG